MGRFEWNWDSVLLLLQKFDQKKNRKHQKKQNKLPWRTISRDSPLL